MKQECQIRIVNPGTERIRAIRSFGLQASVKSVMVDMPRGNGCTAKFGPFPSQEAASEWVRTSSWMYRNGRDYTITGGTI